MGAKVALIEKGRPGGESRFGACVPSKGLVAGGAKLLRQIRGAGEFGIHAGPATVDFAAVMSRLRSVIERDRRRPTRTMRSRPAGSTSSTARPRSRPTTRSCSTARPGSRASGSWSRPARGRPTPTIPGLAEAGRSTTRPSGRSPRFPRA